MTPPTQEIPVMTSLENCFFDPAGAKDEAREMLIAEDEGGKTGKVEETEMKNPE